MTDKTYTPSQSHLQLGDAFYDVVEPAKSPKTIIRFQNKVWAKRVGLADLDDAAWTDHFARFAPLPDNLPRPLALRYHGHQFGTYNPDLGDGRGFLYAQLHDLKDNRLLDLATKGSGPTPWSRGGDGMLTLQGGIREVLASELLEAQGVYTSKSFSLIETGLDLHRGDEPSPARSAVLVRLGHSHIRIGTFQRLAALGEQDNIDKLLAYCIDTYMPEINEEPAPKRTIAFFDAFSAKLAELAAQWTVAGFVHGVLNSDNININGESFDYGPWRFLPTYDPNFTAAYFDQTQRYAFGKQPDTLYWNLQRLAETLLHLEPQEKFQTILDSFAERFSIALGQNLCRRLGLKPQAPAQTKLLTDSWFQFLHVSQIPFEQAFFDCYAGLPHLENEVYQGENFAALASILGEFEPVQTRNHRYFAATKPCTLLNDETQAIWATIHENDDWTLFENKLKAIRQMGIAYGVYKE